jgi:threonine dehydratase
MDMEAKGVVMNIPILSDIKAQYEKLTPVVNKTPVITWDNQTKNEYLSKDTSVFFKCELFQKTGTFKFRGAYTRFSALSSAEKARGIVAGTAGNHGIAAAYVAKLHGVPAKIVVPATMNPFRLEKIESLGAEIVKTESMSQVLEVMNTLVEQEGRTLIHPFDHPLITLGTATLGYEFLQQVPDLDVIILPVGGGGLASGVACAAKLINPNIKVYGVEPLGANTMYLSFQQNKPVQLSTKPDSIADSLCAPCAMPYSFSVCRQFVDDIILVSDEEIRVAMKRLFEEIKVACEPACAVATAALLGKLKTHCLDRKVGLLLCGSNIDINTFFKLLNITS